MSHLLPISHSPHARAFARSGVVVAGGAAAETRRWWPEGVVAVGAAERGSARARERERERARERARKRDRVELQRRWHEEEEGFANFEP